MAFRNKPKKWKPPKPDHRDLKRAKSISGVDAAKKAGWSGKIVSSHLPASGGYVDGGIYPYAATYPPGGYPTTTPVAPTAPPLTYPKTIPPAYYSTTTYSPQETWNIYGITRYGNVTLITTCTRSDYLTPKQAMGQILTHPDLYLYSVYMVVPVGIKEPVSLHCIFEIDPGSGQIIESSL